MCGDGDVAYRNLLTCVSNEGDGALRARGRKGATRMRQIGLFAPHSVSQRSQITAASAFLVSFAGVLISPKPSRSPSRLPSETGTANGPRKPESEVKWNATTKPQKMRSFSTWKIFCSLSRSVICFENAMINFRPTLSRAPSLSLSLGRSERNSEMDKQIDATQCAKGSPFRNSMSAQLKTKRIHQETRRRTNSNYVSSAPFRLGSRFLRVNAFFLSSARERESICFRCVSPFPSPQRRRFECISPMPMPMRHFSRDKKDFSSLFASSSLRSFDRKKRISIDAE